MTGIPILMVGKEGRLWKWSYRSTKRQIQEKRADILYYEIYFNCIILIINLQ